MKDIKDDINKLPKVISQTFLIELICSMTLKKEDSFFIFQYVRNMEPKILSRNYISFTLVKIQFNLFPNLNN